MLGNGRLEAQCFDGTKRLCHIRGKLRKKVWINQSDIILIGLRDYQDHKADVIMKYTADEARNLKTYGELPDTAKINADTFTPDDEIIMFDDVGQTETETKEVDDQLIITSDEESEFDESEDEIAAPAAVPVYEKQKKGEIDIDGI